MYIEIDPHAMTIDPSIISNACSSELRRFRREHSRAPLSRFPELSFEIRYEVIGSVWNRALEANDAYNFKEPAANAEAAVAACIHAGLDKGRIDYSINIYHLSLEHLEYSVYRELSGFTAFPYPRSRYQFLDKRAIGLSKTEFAEFLFAFDKIVPDIQVAVNQLLEDARTILVENEKELMIRRIQEVTKKAATES